jgi:hypothetical protein
MKALKMVTAAALAAVFILSLFACGKSEMMRPKLKKDGVEEFVSALGSGEAKNCYNVTPEDADGFSVFKFADTGKAYAYSDGRITPLYDKEGGVGYISGVGCGAGRLVYTYSYEEDGYKCSAAFFDKSGAGVSVLVTTADLALYPIRQTSDIEGIPDDYGVYFAFVEQYKNKADIGAAIGARAGTVQIGADGAVFSPDPATGLKTVGKIVYENIKKVIVMNVDTGYGSVTYTEKSDIDRITAFLKAVKTDKEKREAPGDAAKAFIISLFYEDGSAGVVYIVGEYVKFGSDGYYKITSGGDVNELLDQLPSSEVKQ